MKTQCPQSIKFMRLKRRLQVPAWQVVGVLESLWLFTCLNTPRGDIGRHENEDIAAWMEWVGDADSLIRDLIDCGFLDECEEHRLVVHDWPEHCPGYLKGALAKNEQTFATVTPKHGAKQSAKHRAKEPPKQDAKDAAEVGQQSPPILFYPNLTNSSSSPSPPSSVEAAPEVPLEATTRTADFASQEPRRGGSSVEADWRNCEITLRQLGVAEAGPACQAARSNGATSSDVLAVVEHFTKVKAWKLGALAWRVKACAPGLKPQDGWPPREASARASPKAETDEQRVDRENFAAMQIVRAGRRAKLTDDEIEREIRAKGLGAAGARLGWRLEQVDS